MQGYHLRFHMNRQDTINAVQSNRDSGPSCLNVLLLPTAIAAVVVASQYEEDKKLNPCYYPKGYVTNGEKYVIELQLFCYIAGYVQIGFSALVCLAQSCALFRADSKGTIMNVVNAPSFCLFVAYLVWAGIGLYMYDRQMTDLCKEQDIAKVIAARSIFQYCLLCLGCACLGCLVCCAGTLGLTFAAANAGSAEEQMNFM